MNKLTLSFIVIALFAVNLFAQSPQYYNLNNGTSSNSFPFNVTGGKAVNSLFLAGEFNQPSPVPSGMQITKVYFRHSTTTSRVLTNFHILMAQSSITTLTTGQFYPGPWDTVFFSASANLTATAGGWSVVTLDTPFPYDPNMSLVLFVGQCGATGSGGSVYNTTLTGIRRTWSVGGCPFTPYSGGDAYMLNFGIDVESAAPPICTMYSSQWCPASTFPNLPQPAYFQASAWIGDTMYVQVPTTGGAGATTVLRYTYGGTWSTGVPLPSAKVGGTLTECGGKLYYIGGGTTSITTGTTDVYSYDPSTGAWTTKASMPLALAAHGAECWGDSVIFVYGGPYSGAATNLNVYYYRVGSNTWGTITNSLPSGQGRRTFSHGISGNKLFMAAGYNTAYLKSFYIGTIGSNASQITWTAGPDVPFTGVGISRPGGTAYDQYFYVVGGELNPTGYGTDAYVWQVNDNSWHTPSIAPKPIGVSNIFSAVTAHCVNDTVRIFVPGGYNAAAVANFDVIACGPLFVGNTGISSNLPAVYSLSQNYPNPFNPSTKISFALPKAGNVKLVVYDILGREVAVLVNEFRTSGNHSVEFNAGNLASGVYLYRIESGTFTDTKKMLLVK